MTHVTGQLYVAANTTVIVMSDSRPLSTNGYHALSYQVNAKYASLHNYTITFVHTSCMKQASSTKECIACVHPIHGERTTPWCKLVAINRTMHAYPTHTRFVYMDSDAIISSSDPLPSYYWKQTLNMFYNFPWTYVRACTGIQFWKRSGSSESILRAWWDTRSKYNTKHDYEQSVLKSDFWHNFKHDIHIIQEKTLVYEPGQRFRHIAHNAAAHRMAILYHHLNASTNWAKRGGM